MTSHDVRRVEAAPALTDDQIDRARLSLAEHAADADELRELIAMMGLDEATLADEINSPCRAGLVLPNAYNNLN